VATKFVAASPEENFMPIRHLLTVAAALTVPAIASADLIQYDPSGGLATEIDPLGNGDDLNAVAIGANITEAAVEALPDVVILADFNDFPGAADEAAVTFGNGLPDLFVSGPGPLNNDGLALSDRGGASNQESVRVNENAPRVLDFGAYDASSNTFDFSVNPVEVVAFGIAGARPNADGTPSTFTATFLADDDTVLSTQTFVATDNDGVFFGFDSGAGLPIGRVEITGTNASNRNAGLDDIAFTVIPEPATLSLLAAAGLGLIRRR
jgi:hypothetical protein